MRILHIIPSLERGGAERLCLDICNEMGQRDGLDVKLVCLKDAVEYNILNVGCTVDFVPASVQLSLIKPTGFCIARLEEYIHNFKPDIIHSHLFEAEIVSRGVTYPRAKWFSHGHDNIPQLARFGIGALTSKVKVTKLYERSYLMNRYRKNGGNRFIAISKDVQKYLQDVLPADLNNVTLLPNAINRKRFTRPAGYQSPVNSVIQLVTVGNLVDKKNQTFLIDMVQLLVNKNVNVHLHVLGYGPNRQKLEEKTAMLGLGSHITFHGNVENVQQYLWDADVYVHGAYYEPFGLVLVEAMAAGLPIVSLDGGGNRDIITNGKNGYILPGQNVKAFAEKVLDLVNNKTLYAEIKAAGLATAAQYDIVNYADKLLALYKQSLLES